MKRCTHKVLLINFYVFDEWTYSKTNGSGVGTLCVEQKEYSSENREHCMPKIVFHEWVFKQ